MMNKKRVGSNPRMRQAEYALAVVLAQATLNIKEHPVVNTRSEAERLWELNELKEMAKADAEDVCLKQEKLY